jgi:hypothetical protein
VYSIRLAANSGGLGASQRLFMGMKMKRIAASGSRKHAPDLHCAHKSGGVSGGMRGLRAHNRVTIRFMFMQIAVFAMKVLEVMFFVGLVGSSVVVVISFIEDGKELFGGDE